ncbi:MAG: GatB/YqeY domain-containing protein [Nevskiales bacterium]|nr:GatB/YqeY domain-containing protein [Nevskiales bacterium]
MASLKDRIQEDLKSALRAGETLRLSTVRMALSEIKRFEVDKGVPPDEATALSLIEKMVKQRRDSESQFRAGQRPELADKEAEEIRILSAYLPQALSEAELSALVAQALQETGAVSAKDMGKVMAWIKPKAAGRTDLGKLSGRVKSALEVPSPRLRGEG